MDSGVLIAVIIGIVVVAVVFLLRDRITGLRAKASVEKREGEFEVKAAAPAAAPRTKPDAFAVRADENKLLGENEINIEGTGVDASGNFMAGKNKINVNVPQQPQQPTPKKNRK